MWGELVAAVALPGAAAPVAAASGLPWQITAALWVAWTLGYASSVVAVHEVLRRQRRRAPGLSLAGLGIVVACASISVRELVVALPLVGLGAVVAIRLPPAKRVRAIGVALVIAATAGAVLALALAR